MFLQGRLPRNWHRILRSTGFQRGGQQGNNQKKITFLNDSLQRGYRFLNETYIEWEDARKKCQSLGARLPVLDTKETIDIVKSYLDNADPEELKALAEWDQSSRRVWLGLNFSSDHGKTGEYDFNLSC